MARIIRHARASEVLPRTKRRYVNFESAAAGWRTRLAGTDTTNHLFISTSVPGGPNRCEQSQPLRGHPHRLPLSLTYSDLTALS